MKHRFIKNPSAICENLCKSVAGFASVTPISNHSMKSSILCLSLILAVLSSNPSAAENAVKAFQEWAVGIDYREDVYKAIKAFADTHPKLTGEDEKLFKETLRDYRRAGLELPQDQRKEIEQLRKELSKLGTDFDTNVVKATAPVMFAKADLDGLPESFLAAPGIKTGDDVYTVMAN